MTTTKQTKTEATMNTKQLQDQVDRAIGRMMSAAAELRLFAKVTNITANVVKNQVQAQARHYQAVIDIACAKHDYYCAMADEQRGVNRVMAEIYETAAMNIRDIIQARVKGHFTIDEFYAKVDAAYHAAKVTVVY